MSLPEGITWMEHMDLVSAIRLGSIGLNTFKKCEEYFPERLSQYFMSGLPKDSDEYRDLEASFRSVSLGTNCLVPHFYDLAIFWVEWEKYPVLSRIRKWWNDLPVHFEISPVGVALSNAYIHSKDPSIPCLY